MKKKIIIFIVIVFVLGTVAYLLNVGRHNTTPSLPSHVSVEKQSVSTGGVPDFARQVVVSSVVVGSTSYSCRTVVEKGKVWYREWPKSSVDTTLNVLPIILPAQTGNNITGRNDLIHFIGLISNDIQHVTALLKQENFTVTEWNLFKQTIINDPTAPISWSVSFNGTNRTIGGIRKIVFKDNSRKNEIRSEGYNLNFFPGGYILERLARNDGSECLLFFPNGQIEMYGHRLANMNYYGIHYNENGEVAKETISKPSPQVISAQKKLIEKYKNDPYVGEGIKQLEAELQTIQTNQ